MLAMLLADCTVAERLCEWCTRYVTGATVFYRRSRALPIGLEADDAALLDRPRRPEHGGEPCGGGCNCGGGGGGLECACGQHHGGAGRLAGRACERPQCLPGYASGHGVAGGRDEHERGGGIPIAVVYDSDGSVTDMLAGRGGEPAERVPDERGDGERGQVRPGGLHRRTRLL